MSHRWDCPTDYEARRAGSRDYEDRGYRSYSGPYDCDAANEAYLRGQRSAEYEAEQRAEEQACERRRQEYIAEQEREAYYNQQRWEQDRENEDQYIVDCYEADLITAEVWGGGP